MKNFIVLIGLLTAAFCIAQKNVSSSMSASNPPTIDAELWVGGSIGYFPIDCYLVYFIAGTAFGLIIVFLSGFNPSRKAAKVDQEEIFRGKY